MEGTKVLLTVPRELDYKLNIRLAEQKKLGVKNTKAQEIIKLTEIGLLNDKAGPVNR